MGVVQKSSTSSTSPSAGAGSFFGLGTAVSGTIKLVTGTSSYVAEATGTVLKVQTSAGTAVTVSSPASLSQLHPGETVTVVAQKNGWVSATSVSTLRSTAAGAATGGFRG